MEEQLKELRLNVRWSDDPDREVIDFSIDDGKDNVAWVWGSEPFNDIQIECNHPEVEYGDDDERGECKICGATCDWHWEESADDGRLTKERVPHDWYAPKHIGGIVGEYLEELRKEF